LLTISEVADLIGVHRSSLYRPIGRAGPPLPVIRVGATMRVPRVAVERLLSGDLASSVATLAGRV
jgi:excisionase family DNA binding protein